MIMYKVPIRFFTLSQSTQAIKKKRKQNFRFAKFIQSAFPLPQARENEANQPLDRWMTTDFEKR